jgi:hypothetical protein
MKYIKNALKEFIAWMAIFGAMPFLAFHVFLFGIQIYKSALEIPLFLILPLVWLCCLRVISYTPRVSGNETPIFPSPFKKRKPYSFHAILEALFWYSIIAVMYFSYSGALKFPEIVEAKPVALIIKGYVLFFIGSIVGMLVIAYVTKSAKAILTHIKAFRELAHRIVSVVLTYIAVSLVFSAIFRSLSIYNTDSFSGKLSTSIDFFYFSVVTITTLSYGDIYLKTDMAKIMVVCESLIGIYLLAILIGLTISVSLKKKETNNAINTDN